MDSRVIAELVLHLGRITSGDGLVGGLTPGQWAILRYLASANRFSRTPSAFAAFHGTTRGTASQAIKNLAARGYLKQTRSKIDGRSVRLDLTNKARAIAAKDPLDALVQAADDLPLAVRGHFSNGLQRLLGHVASATNKPLFGTCSTCGHLEDDGCCKEGLPVYTCGFMSESLTEEEMDELCISFSPDKPSSPRMPSVGGA